MSVPRRAEGRIGRSRQWWNGWRMALRMARREVRRDWGRSLFVWLMIALPVATICALQVVITSNDISEAERLDLKLGAAQAVLTQTGSAFDPGWDGYGSSLSGGEDGASRPVPGWGTTIAEHEAAVSALAGRPVLAVTQTDFQFGRTRKSLWSIGVDAARPEAVSAVRLLSGRVPRAAAEVLVTPRGLSNGLPEAGTVTLYRADKTEFAATVVGIAEGHVDYLVDVVTLPEPNSDRMHFFVTAGAPVTWAEAENFASYGFETASRGIAADPPSQEPFNLNEAGPQFLIWSVIVAAMLEVALVVGPAFAIGAARQRRGLALAASNGANQAQLRRSALGQALLLGLTAAVVGVLLGGGLGVLGWLWIASDRTELHGPLEIPVGRLLGTFVLGVATAVVAALVTTRGLAKLDLVASLRGTLRSAPPRRGAPVLGVALAAVGLAGVWLAMGVIQELRFWVWLAAALAVLVGALLCVPGLLVITARLAGGAPMAMRMALRDTSRQRGRATSTVAAILAGGLILSTIWTLMLSFEADAARRYRPWIPIGHGNVDAEPGAAERLAGLRSAIAGVSPTLRTFQLSQVGGYGADADNLQAIVVLRPGCTLGDLYFDTADCAALSSEGSAYGSELLAGDAAELGDLFSLDADQRAALATGALLVSTDRTDDASQPKGAQAWAQTQIIDGTITFTYRPVDAEASPAAPQTATVPATGITREVIRRGASEYHYGALVSNETAAKLGWVMSMHSLRIVDSTGAISPELEAQLAEAIEPWGDYDSFSVERGFTPTPQPVMWGVTATLVLLAVVAAVIATVMSTIELRPFLGTFAAIGAGPGLSRRLAAIQALLLGVLGTVLGCVIGAAIAAPLAMSVTGGGSYDVALDPVVAFPWTLMAGLAVGVPLLAAVVASLCVPARPTLVRRAT